MSRASRASKEIIETLSLKKIHSFSQKIENKSLGIVGGVHVLLLTSGAMSSLKSKIAFALIAQHYCKV